MSDKEGAVFVGQLHDVRTKADGGGRMTIDFGRDALDEIMWLQKQASYKNNFQVAFVPMAFVNIGGDNVDTETGEVIL